VVEATVQPRKGASAICGGCGVKRRGYDRLGSRSFAFVPLWGMAVFLVYAMRRVDCPRCGVVAEMVPWAEGKSPMTHAFTWFLASWAKVLSWKETARRFRSSWDAVFRAVEHAVCWGLEHRNLDGIRAIGVDELSWKKGQKYLTLVYQIDHGCRRLLHIAQKRTAASFHSFFDLLGDERARQIHFVASDMWKAFLGVVRKRCCAALHVLDRFHVAQLLSKAVDETRRQEVRTLRARGRHVVLTKTRWLLLKRPKNLTRKERGRLRDLLTINLRSVRAYLLKEQFQHFWRYKSATSAYWFLRDWIRLALRSRIEPFKKFARTLREHQRELLTWFLARGEFAAGATEGFNNKARISTRKAYGFRSYKHAEIALYHALGNLPEPPWLTHRFC
jgi:transposase